MDCKQWANIGGSDFMACHFNPYTAELKYLTVTQVDFSRNFISFISQFYLYYFPVLYCIIFGSNKEILCHVMLCYVMLWFNCRCKGVSLTEINAREVASAEQDQTARMCRPILLYTHRKQMYDGNGVNPLPQLSFSQIYNGESTILRTCYAEFESGKVRYGDSR